MKNIIKRLFDKKSKDRRINTLNITLKVLLEEYAELKEDLEKLKAENKKYRKEIKELKNGK